MSKKFYKNLDFTFRTYLAISMVIMAYMAQLILDLDTDLNSLKSEIAAEIEECESEVLHIYECEIWARVTGSLKP